MTDRPHASRDPSTRTGADTIAFVRAGRERGSTLDGDGLAEVASGRLAATVGNTTEASAGASRGAERSTDWVPLDFWAGGGLGRAWLSGRKGPGRGRERDRAE